MRISDWSSDVCSSDLADRQGDQGHQRPDFRHPVGHRRRGGRHPHHRRDHLRDPRHLHHHRQLRRGAGFADASLLPHLPRGRPSHPLALLHRLLFSHCSLLHSSYLPSLFLFSYPFFFFFFFFFFFLS